MVEVGQVLELEKSRSARESKRIALQARALELADAQDQRQFEFHCRNRDQQYELATKRSDFGQQLIWAILGASVFLVGLAFAMVFFGDGDQRTIAITILTNTAIGMAGYGLVTGLLRLARVLMGGREQPFSPRPPAGGPSDRA